MTHDAAGQDADRGEHELVTPDPRPLSDVERDLLILLASGATHEAASRRLGIPLRTARRRIAALMRELGASSPFQAGAEAAKRGWLYNS